MSARDQLERLLYVLPRASQAEGARIGELARALEVEPATILADIEELTTREYYHPAGFVDAFSLSLDGDVVRLYSKKEFCRPVRLNPGEAMALGLGLRVLAAEADERRGAEIMDLAVRLEQELVVPALDAPPAMQIALGADDMRGTISDAIEQRVYCTLTYLKAGASEPVERVVAPLRLLYTNGHWYMSAVGRDSTQPHAYRVDRILELQPLEERHEHAPPAPDAAAFTTSHGRKVRVRYSKRIARWLAERENAQCEADGTLVLEHDVVDMNWLVRHVLQYAGEAVVEDAEPRAAVARAAARLDA